MSSDTKQQIEDLFQMGFIQESEYKARLKAIGIEVDENKNDSNTHENTTMSGSRDNLISSFDTSNLIDKDVFNSVPPAINSNHSSKKPFQQTNCDQNCVENVCSRCGASVPFCVEKDHKFVCFVANDPSNEIEHPCPMSWNGCSSMIKASEFTKHLSDECRQANVICRGIIKLDQPWQTSAFPNSPKIPKTMKQYDGVCNVDLPRNELLKHALIHNHAITNIEPEHGNKQAPLAPSVWQDDVSCPLTYLGCSTQLKSTEIAAHLRECPQNQVRCMNRFQNDDNDQQPLLAGNTLASFGARVVIDSAVDPMSEESYRELFDRNSDDENDYIECDTACGTCQTVVQRNEVAQHHIDCHEGRSIPFRGLVPPFIICPVEGCSRRIGRRRIWSHLQHCRARIVECACCGQDISVQEIAGHACRIDENNSRIGVVVRKHQEVQQALHASKYFFKSTQ